jgi:hypothetical protein
MFKQGFVSSTLRSKELLFNVDSLETFMLQLVWRKINPHSVKSSLTFFQKILITNSRNSSTFKAFLAPIHKKVYSAKLRRNWNASMCVEKETMQDLQRKRSIRSSTWWLLFFAWWVASFSWLWWLIKRFLENFYAISWGRVLNFLIVR